MKQQHYLLLKVWLSVISAVFFVSVPFWAEVDKDGPGLLLVFSMAILFVYLAYSHQKKMKGARKEEMAYAPPTDATVDQQIKFYKTYLIIGLVGFLLLAAITIPDINDLETKAIERVYLWAPIAFLYEHGGYWPAILSIPLAALVITLLFLRKLHSSRRKTE
jgi:hypothetical protein